MEPTLPDQEINELRQQLRARMRALKSQVQEELLASENEQYVALAGRVHDTGDESVADLLADVGLAVIDQHVKEIQDIEAALMRMPKGTYGICIDCGETIAYPRLQAYPTAKRCYECQARHETSYAQPKRSGL